MDNSGNTISEKHEEGEGSHEGEIMRRVEKTMLERLQTRKDHGTIREDKIEEPSEEAETTSSDKDREMNENIEDVGKEDMLGEVENAVADSAEKADDAVLVKVEEPEEQGDADEVISDEEESDRLIIDEDYVAPSDEEDEDVEREESNDVKEDEAKVAIDEPEGDNEVKTAEDDETKEEDMSEKKREDDMIDELKKSEAVEDLEEKTDEVEEVTEKVESRVDEAMKLLISDINENGKSKAMSDEEKWLEEIDREAEAMGNQQGNCDAVDDEMDVFDKFEDDLAGVALESANEKRGDIEVDGIEIDLLLSEELGETAETTEEKEEESVDQHDENNKDGNMLEDGEKSIEKKSSEEKHEDIEVDGMEVDLLMTEEQGGTAETTEEKEEENVDHPEEKKTDGKTEEDGESSRESKPIEEKHEDKTETDAELKSTDEAAEKTDLAVREDNVDQREENNKDLKIMGDEEPSMEYKSTEEKLGKEDTTKAQLMEATDEDAKKTDSTEEEKHEADDKTEAMQSNNKDEAAKMKEVNKNKKSKRADDEEEKEWIVSCICGEKDDNGEPLMLCDICEIRWEHVECIFPKTKKAPKGDYYCHVCKPRPTELTPAQAREYQDRVKDEKEMEQQSTAERKKKQAELAKKNKAEKDEVFASVKTPGTRGRKSGWTSGKNSTPVEEKDKENESATEATKKNVQIATKKSSSVKATVNEDEMIDKENKNEEKRDKLANSKRLSSLKVVEKKSTAAAETKESSLPKKDEKKDNEGIALDENAGDVAVVRDKNGGNEEENINSSIKKNEAEDKKDDDGDDDENDCMDSDEVETESEEDSNSDLSEEDSDEDDDDDDDYEDEEEDVEEEEEEALEKEEEEEDAEITVLEVNTIKGISKEDGGLLEETNRLVKGFRQRNKRQAADSDDDIILCENDSGTKGDAAGTSAVPPSKKTRPSGSTTQHSTVKVQAAASAKPSASKALPAPSVQPSKEVNRVKPGASVQSVESPKPSSSCVKTTPQSARSFAKPTRSTEYPGPGSSAQATQASKSKPVPEASVQPAQLRNSPIQPSSSADKQLKRQLPASISSVAIAPLAMEYDFVLPSAGAISSKIKVDVPKFRPVQPTVRPSLEIPLRRCTQTASVDGNPRIELYTGRDDFFMSGKVSGAIYFKPENSWPEPTARVGFCYYMWTSNSGRWSRSEFVTVKAEKGRETRVRFVLDANLSIYCDEEEEQFVLRKNSLINKEKITIVALAGAQDVLKRSEECVIDLDKSSAVGNSKKSRLSEANVAGGSGNDLAKRRENRAAAATAAEPTPPAPSPDFIELD